MAKRPSHAAANGTPYVRHGTKTKKARPEREKWSVNLKTILSATEDETVARFTDIGILEDKTGKTCPFCKEGELDGMRQVTGRGLRYRCKHRGC